MKKEIECMLCSIMIMSLTACGTSQFETGKEFIEKEITEELQTKEELNENNEGTESSQEDIETQIEEDESETEEQNSISVSAKGVSILDADTVCIIDNHEVMWKKELDEYDIMGNIIVTVDGKDVVFEDREYLLDYEAYIGPCYHIVHDDGNDYLLFDIGYDNDYGAQFLLKYEKDTMVLVDSLSADNFDFVEDGTFVTTSNTWCFGSHTMGLSGKITSDGFETDEVYVVNDEDEEYSFEALQDFQVDQIFDVDTKEDVSDGTNTVVKGTRLYVYAVSENEKYVVFRSRDTNLEYKVTYTVDWDNPDAYTLGYYYIHGVDEAHLFGTQNRYAG